VSVSLLVCEPPHIVTTDKIKKDAFTQRNIFQRWYKVFQKWLKFGEIV